MSMEIQIENRGYRIRLSGDRRRFVASTGVELVEAVRHHFRLGHTGISECPLCRTARVFPMAGKRPEDTAVVRIRRKRG